MDIKTIYEDKELLVVDKSAGIDVIEMMNSLVKEDSQLKKVGEEPRYGLIHRLDKDTSGVILVAKSNQGLIFFQKQFKKKNVKKKYLALVVGNIKEDKGEIKTLIGRGISDRKKQKVYLPHEPHSEGKRDAITDYKVVKRFKDYTLLEVYPQTGRKHQIRTHFSYLGHPIVGDKVYGFKNQPCPKGLDRHFLHAQCIKIDMLDGKRKEFCSDLPNSLQNIINKLSTF